MLIKYKESVIFWLIFTLTSWPFKNRAYYNGPEQPKGNKNCVVCKEIAYKRLEDYRMVLEKKTLGMGFQGILSPHARQCYDK